jgi:uncharacterized protein
MINKRIDLIDALRGFAIMAILLLHNLEHFDFVYKPEALPPFIKAIDKQIWDVAKFLFAGKAYAIFALLFGFSFYLMDRKQQEKGLDFRGRFLWRMVILLGFGMINSSIYQGDILTYYAVLGVTMVLVCRWDSKWILLTSILLLLQPLEIYKLFHSMGQPEIETSGLGYQHYFKLSHEYLAGSSFWEVLKGNFTNGRWGVIIWSWEKGRILQIPALFMLGYLLGKQGRFESNVHYRFWQKMFLTSILCALPLYFAKGNLDLINESIRPSVKLMVNSYYNVAFMFILVSAFVLLFQYKRFQSIVDPLRILGRMSLTSYVMQSIVGACVYYGFGLGLYQYTGASYSLLIGLVMLFLQVRFCKWWLSRHKQGPLEYFWHRATWINIGTTHCWS